MRKVVHRKKIEKEEKPGALPSDVRIWTVLTFFVLIVWIFAVCAFLYILFPQVTTLRLVWGDQEYGIVSPLCTEQPEPKQIIKVLATAYSSTPDQTDATPCATATGYDLCESYAKYGSANTIAANFLPLHTVVKIPELYGDELFVVRDRMNERFYKKIDLWMPTRSQAIRFGIKYVTIEVY